jgi:hypothetical protein
VTGRRRCRRWRRTVRHGFAPHRLRSQFQRAGAVESRSRCVYAEHGRSPMAGAYEHELGRRPALRGSGQEPSHLTFERLAVLVAVLASQNRPPSAAENFSVNRRSHPPPRDPLRLAHRGRGHVSARQRDGHPQAGPAKFTRLSASVRAAISQSSFEGRSLTRPRRVVRLGYEPAARLTVRGRIHHWLPLNRSRVNRTAIGREMVRV